METPDTRSWFSESVTSALSIFYAFLFGNQKSSAPQVKSAEKHACSQCHLHFLLHFSASYLSKPTYHLNPSVFEKHPQALQVTALSIIGSFLVAAEAVLSVNTERSLDARNLCGRNLGGHNVSQGASLIYRVTVRKRKWPSKTS